MVKITISGAAGSGKSTIAEIIDNALRAHGLKPERFALDYEHDVGVSEDAEKKAKALADRGEHIVIQEICVKMIEMKKEFTKFK